MYKYIDWIIFTFVLIQMAISAKHQDLCWTVLWGVVTLGVWIGMLAKLLKS